MGARSSSEAVTICVATSGCQATALQRILELESLIWMMGSFFLKSHTTDLPLGEVEIRMCWTWEGGGTGRRRDGEDEGWEEGWGRVIMNTIYVH